MLILQILLFFTEIKEEKLIHDIQTKYYEKKLEKKTELLKM